MITLMIQIPDDVARGLEGLANNENKSVEQLAVDQLTNLVGCLGSPMRVLRAMRDLPPADREAVDEMEAGIAASKLPVEYRGIFDNWPER